MRIKLTLLVSAIAMFVFFTVALPGYAADPPLPNIPSTNFNITTFGATGNGSTDNANAIQNAINAAASVGGGTVIVASVGVLTNYLSGPLNLSNNVCLQINVGTKLQMLPMGSWVNPGTNFINGAKLHDVAITGSGIIDGQGTNWWFPLASPRPTLINFSGCTNVLIQNVTLQNPPTFHIVVKGGDVNVTIQGITINSPFDSHNTDGIDIGSTNALIRNCTINDGDDNIAFGSGSTGITISNCAFGVGHGLSIGSSTSGGINNLLVSNCTWNGTEYGIHIKSDRGAGGLVQNLVYRDLTMTNVNFVVAIYTYYNQIGSPSRTINETPFGASTNGVIVTNNIPNFRNITISNVTASTVHGVGNIAGIIWGLPEMLVSNVVLSHVNFTDATNTFCVYNAKGIQFIDCNLATPANTNTFTLYNADVTVTNSATNSTPVTLGGLALPPTNNTLAFFNAQAAVTDTNMLGTGLIALGGSTLLFTQNSAIFLNNLAVLSTSTVTMTSGSNSFGGSLSGPGLLTLNLPATSLLTILGDPSSFTGALTVSNGTVVVNNAMGAGTLTAAGGTLALGSLAVGLPGTPTGVVWVTGGQLIATNTTVVLGSSTNSVGSMTVSNGNALMGGMIIGNTLGSGGTLTIAGGVSTLSSNLTVARATGSTGVVWVTSGRLDASLQKITLGSSGTGLMTVSNGEVVVGQLFIGLASSLRGTLNVMGGTLVVTNSGDGELTVFGGVYTQNGGVVTVDRLSNNDVPNSGFTFNGGLFQVQQTSIINGKQFAIGNGVTSATYRLLGGDHYFNSSLRVRNTATLSGCGTVESNSGVVVDPGGTVVADCGGSLTFNGGNVTNNGTIRAINGSVLEFYYPVVNNGVIDITGGTTNFHDTFINNGSIIGGPASGFQITGIASQGSNIFVTWATSVGKTNELQATAGAAGGSYGTNNFVPIFTITNTVGATTNYLDIGGATNRPSRYYRVRLVP